MADHDDSETARLKESPAEAYQQWRRRKARVEMHYRIERGKADRKRKNESSNLVKRARDLTYAMKHLEEQPELLAELQSAVKGVLKETTAQTKQRIMWTMLQHQIKKQSSDQDLLNKIDELTVSNRELSEKMRLLLSFYSSQEREKTMNELDLQAEAFIQKMFAKRTRKKK